MPKLVSLITCTGSRPLALSMCERFMARQTYKGPIQWIIVDDSDAAHPISSKVIGAPHITQEFYRGPKSWRPGINTQRPNMDEGIKHVKGDYILVVEDDDWYSPHYIETYLWLLTRYPVVGEGNSRYYALKDRMYKEWNNFRYASLCNTAMHAEMLPVLDEAVNSGQLFPDMEFWRKCNEKEIPNVILINLYLGVGIKQMPGRPGIGSGHHTNAVEGFIKDPGFNYLKKWVGEEDARHYINITIADGAKK